MIRVVGCLSPLMNGDLNHQDYHWLISHHYDTHIATLIPNLNTGGYEEALGIIIGTKPVD